VRCGASFRAWSCDPADHRTCSACPEGAEYNDLVREVINAPSSTVIAANIGVDALTV
jgi:hypothetical protein